MKRFIDAQRKDSGMGADYETALAEIRSGRKFTHWIWYIFPQIQGLGYSPMTQKFAIKDIDEARQYLNDETLGPRLREIASALLAVEGRTALEILGSPDDMKVKSCMTLFDYISPNDIFNQVLLKYYNGSRCTHTIKTLTEQGNQNVK